MIIESLWILVVMCGAPNESNEKYFNTFSDKGLALSWAKDVGCPETTLTTIELWEVSASSKTKITTLRKYK